MSGIAGIFSKNKLSYTQECIMKSIQHDMALRGNDKKGKWISQSKQVMFAYNMLSFRNTPEEISQTLTYENLTIVYDGSIYNYKELKRQLVQNGYAFLSDNEMEVILKAYHFWGENVLKKIHGTFAFAIWDDYSHTLTLCRDRFGLKPLYYYFTEKEFYFASSLPALVKNVNSDKTISKEALLLYLSMQAVLPPPYTPFNEFNKLAPQSILQISLSAERLQVFYKKNDIMVESFTPIVLFQDIKIEMVRDYLIESISNRIPKDTDIGLWLSGGLDSSLITAICVKELGIKPKTISIAFNGSNDYNNQENELCYSRDVVAKYPTQHMELFIEDNEILNNIEDCLRIANEPMMSNDYIGHYILSKYTHQQGLKVALTGLGADEIWYGYSWHKELLYTNMNKINCFYKAFVERNFNKCESIISKDFIGPNYLDMFVLSYLDRFDMNGFESAVFSNLDLIMPEDPIKRSDSAGMSHMVELRAPFLDENLVDLSFKIPHKIKLFNGIGKYILKKVAEEYFSKPFIYRKKGHFTVPAINMTTGKVHTFCRDVLLSESCRNRGVFQTEMLEALVNQKKANITQLGGNLLWQLTCYEYWMQQFD